MTNEEKFKTPEERNKAFEEFCGGYSACCNCQLDRSVGDCRFAWLLLEADEKKLLPCPFCGGSASVIRVLNGDDFAVWCEGCHTISGTHNTKDEAITAWNKRAK